MAEQRLFGTFVGNLRKRKKLTLKELGKHIGCSGPKLYKLEHSMMKRPVSPHFVQQLCDALAQSDIESAKLFELAGYPVPPMDDIRRIVRIVQDTLELPELGSFTEELVADIESFVNSWRVLRKARLQAVKKVVIVAAGWQPRLLSLERFERTLLPSIDEAARANIRKVLLVVPPNMPDVRLLRQTFPKMSIGLVVQQEPLGLGHAVLVAKDRIEHEPFAVLLPDEIDESRRALGNLVQAYYELRKPIVAVDTYEPEDDVAVLRYFGFARLGEPVSDRVFRLSGELVEKPRTRPDKAHLRIAGRYVLTPEIVDALQRTPDLARGPVKHDLTAAINDLWRASTSVLAYRLASPMLSIAPYRAIIHNMDRRKVFNPALYDSRRAVAFG